MLPEERIFIIKTERLVSDLCDRWRDRDRAQMLTIKKSPVTNVRDTAANRQAFQAAAFVKSKLANLLNTVRNDDLN